MSKKGQNWTWPEKTDELTYEREEVVKKTSANCKTVVNKRGFYRIKERLLCEEDDFHF